MITQQRIMDAVCRVDLHHVAGTGSVVCALILMNGHVVIGEAHCANDEPFSAEVGADIARENALGKVGEFLAYQDRGFIQEKTA